MKKLRLIFIMMSLSFVANLHASENQLQYEKKEVPNSLSIGLEYSSLSATTRLSGFGIQLNWQRNLSNSFALDFGLMQVFNFSDGFNYLYTGIGVFTKYAVLGEFSNQSAALYHAGHSLVTEYPEKGDILAIGVGPEQLILNGTSSIFPVTGLSFLLQYQTRFFDLPLSSTLRYSTMSGNNLQITGIFFTLSTELKL